MEVVLGVMIVGSESIRQGFGYYNDLNQLINSLLLLAGVNYIIIIAAWCICWISGGLLKLEVKKS